MNMTSAKMRGGSAGIGKSNWGLLESRHEVVNQHLEVQLKCKRSSPYWKSPKPLLLVSATVKGPVIEFNHNSCFLLNYWPFFSPHRTNPIFRYFWKVSMSNSWNEKSFEWEKSKLPRYLSPQRVWFQVVFRIHDRRIFDRKYPKYR